MIESNSETSQNDPILINMLKKITISSLIMLMFLSCDVIRDKSAGINELNLTWTPIDSINRDLPDGIQVFQAIHVGANLRAWYVQVQESLPKIESRVVVSDDSDGRETVSEFANRLDAEVLINGGYFRMDLNPAKHVGVLKVDGELIHSATPSVLRGEQRFFLHRSAIGFGTGDRLGIKWVSSSGDSIFCWDRPIENLPGQPGSKQDTLYRDLWTSRDVLGGGPLLIRDGNINISINEEVFFGTSIPQVHPRTAAGITKQGDLILLLVDGRQLISRGVDLKELAQILYDLGCQDALNLDGGGSSSLVVNDVLLNRPAGTTTEREVMSAIAVFAK